MNVAKKTTATPLRRIERTIHVGDGVYYDVLECGHNECGQYTGKRRRCRSCADPSFVFSVPTVHRIPIEDAPAPEPPTPRISPEREEKGPAVYTAAEVAELLRVDLKTVHEAARRGEVPGMLRVGRLVRFSRAVLTKWMNRG